MPRILIPNTYTWYNKGDASIVVGMVHAIRRYVPDSEIVTLSFTPDIDQRMYNDLRIKVLRNLLTIPRGTSYYPVVKNLASKVLRYMVLSKTPSMTSRLVDLEEKEVLEAYSGSDIVVGCGGGYLGGYKFSSLLHAYRIYLGKLFGKPIAICAQSIEPMPSTLVRGLTKYFLKKMEIVMVREELSMRYLESIGVKTNVILTADPAFIVPTVSRKEAQRLLASEGIHRDGHLLVGITTRSWGFRGFERRRERLDNFISAIAKTINFLISENAKITFFPQVIYLGDDDRIISRKIQSIVSDSRVTVLEKDHSPQQLRGMIGEMDLFIGTRMHSNIFSTSMGVPTVAIAYQRKTHGVMAMLEMSDYVLDVSDITYEELVSKINDLLDNQHSVRDRLLRGSRRLKELAFCNGKLIKSILPRC